MFGENLGKKNTELTLGINTGLKWIMSQYNVAFMNEDTLTGGSSKEPEDPQDELTNPGNTQKEKDSDPETENDRDTLEKSW